MSINNKQENLRDVDTVLPSLKFSDLLYDLCAKHGQGTLSDMIGMDAGQFSLFKSGDGGISLKHLETLLSTAGVTVIHEKDFKRLMLSFFTINDILKKSLGW